jgi:hypothetical protein
MKDPTANNQINRESSVVFKNKPIIGKLRKALFKIGIGIGAVLLGYQFYQSVFAYLKGEVVFKNNAALVAAVFCMLFGILQQIDAWFLLMKSLNILLPFHDARAGYVLSFLSRYIPGSVWGYISRSEWLQQNYKVRYVDSNIGSVLEILISILACVLIIGISWVGSKNPIIFIPALVIFLPILSWALLHNRFSRRIFNQVLFYLKSSSTYPGVQLRDWLIVLGLLAINWFYFGLAVGLCGVAFGEWNIMSVLRNWLLFTGDFAVSWLAGFLVFFLPSGLGLRELLMTHLLSNQFGISIQSANTISVTMRFVTVIAEVSSVGVVLLIREIWMSIRKNGKLDRKQL